MSNITDAQVEANYNAQGNNAGYLTTYGNTSGEPITEALTTGVAAKISTDRDAYAYVNVVVGSAVVVTMGPEAAGTSVGIARTATYGIGVITVFVPKGWYVVVTGTMADIGITAVLV